MPSRQGDDAVSQVGCWDQAGNGHLCKADSREGWGRSDVKADMLRARFLQAGPVFPWPGSSPCNDSHIPDAKECCLQAQA